MFMGIDIIGGEDLGSRYKVNLNSEGIRIAQHVHSPITSGGEVSKTVAGNHAAYHVINKTDQCNTGLIRGCPVTVNMMFEYSLPVYWFILCTSETR